MRELAGRVLENAGYRVISVSSAREALTVAESPERLDAVVTDVVMPGGMSGVEMGEKPAGVRPAVPVLYMSGYVDDIRFHARDGKETLRFLRKPFQPAELLTRVQQMMKKV